MNDLDREAKAREAAEAREFAAECEAKSERADANGDLDQAERWHRRARENRADARRLEAELAA